MSSHKPTLLLTTFVKVLRFCSFHIVQRTAAIRLKVMILFLKFWLFSNVSWSPLSRGCCASWFSKPPWTIYWRQCCTKWRDGPCFHCVSNRGYTNHVVRKFIVCYSNHGLWLKTLSRGYKLLMISRCHSKFFVTINQQCCILIITKIQQGLSSST